MTSCDLKPSRFLRMLGLGVWLLLPAAMAAKAQPAPATSPSAPASAAVKAKAQALLKAQLSWQKSMAVKPRPGNGCYEADYPNPDWKSVPCGKAPAGPQILAHALRVLPQGLRPALQPPATVGNGTDYAAIVTGKATSITGSFALVQGVKSLTPGKDPTNTYTSASNFSLQLNTNRFTTSACNGAKVPSSCQGWVQFLYSNTGGVYIEYTLINWSQAKCPNGYTPYPAALGGTATCYFNTLATPVPVQSLANLANLALNGTATNGGNDVATITISPTKSLSKPNTDSALGLSQNWNAAEYNLVGDQNGTQVDFNPATVTIAVRMSVISGSGNLSPSCSTTTYPGGNLITYDQTFTGWTGEFNNLTLARDCYPEANNSIVFDETNGLIITNFTPLSAPATGAPVVITGNGFTGVSAVTVQASDALPATNVPFTFVSDSQINITTPPCSALGCGQGTFGEAVHVTTPAGTAISPIGILPYAYVNKVVPNIGSTGTKITVSGNGFYNYTPEQSFVVGGTPAQDVACSPRNTQCTMTVPPRGGGPADVQLGTAASGGLSPTNPNDVFDYSGNGGPTILAINPHSGTQDGGTLITITGTGFTQAMEAAFGTYYIGITGDCPTSTQCTFQTPRWTGQSPVHIIVGGYAAGSPFSNPGNADLFSYTPPPPTGLLSPGYGSLAGNTPVTAELSNFVAQTNDTQILFNFNGTLAAATSVSCTPGILSASDSNCTFRTPPLSPAGPGPVAVPVTVSANGNSLSVGNFTYEQSLPPTQTQCQICEESGGTCSTINGRFYCRKTICPSCGCTRSSPTGKCQ